MQTPTSYSEFLLSGIQTLGFYKIQFPHIVIEAPDRTSGRDFRTVFEHEATHKFLIELSDLGFLLLFENIIQKDNTRKQPNITLLLQPLLTDFTFHQECFATNVEIAASRIYGLDSNLILSNYPPAYREAYYALGEIHPLLLKCPPGEAQLYILNIGLHTLGIQIFTILRGSKESINIAIAQKLQNGEFNMHKRLLRSISAFTKTFNDANSAEENIQNHNREFGSDFSFVSSTSLQTLYDNLNSFNLISEELKVELEAYMPRYAPSSLSDLKNLWERMAGNGLLDASIHFHHRFAYDMSYNIFSQELSTVCKEAKFAYLNIAENVHNIEMQHGVFSIPGAKSLVLVHTYPAPLTQPEAMNTNEYVRRSQQYESAFYCSDDRENNTTQVFELLNTSSCLIVSYIISFDFSAESFLGRKLADFNRLKLILTTPYFSLFQLKYMCSDIFRHDKRYLVHFINLGQSLTFFFCLRPAENRDWMFLAPLPEVLVESAVSEIETKYDNIKLCADKVQFGMDKEMEQLIVIFLAHFTYWGW